MNEMWELFPFVFRINDNSSGQTKLTILEEVCKERGWKEFRDKNLNYPERGIWNWNLWWKSIIKVNDPMCSYSWQYTNHIPKAINFCNKEYLASFGRNMKDRFGEIFNFCPQTFTLPQEAQMLQDEHARRSQINLNSGDHLDECIQDNKAKRKNGHHQVSPIWICKPAKKSQGRGIFLVDNLTTLPEHPVTVVQEYITKPLLISGYKFDLRLYVCIVSLSPLTIYLYREGLTRFATEPYDLSDLANICSHLTNSSINKLNPGYEKDKAVIGHGCKWPLKKLREYLREDVHLTDWIMWQRVMSIIMLTILGEAAKQQQHFRFVSNRNNFEFLGYDILIDENLKPWLLETNLSPGLGEDCDVDQMIKKPLLHQLFTLLGLPDHRSHMIPPNGVENNGMTKPKSDTKLNVPPDTTKESTEAQDKTCQPGKTKKRKEDCICPNLRKRLLDARAIYSQNLSLSLVRNRKKSKRLSSQSNNLKPSTAASFVDNFVDATKTDLLTSNTDWMWSLKSPKSFCKDDKASSSSDIGLQRRSWHDAPARHGDWERIFPFDVLSFQISRGHHTSDVKAIVKKLEHYLNAAEKLTSTNPGQSDEYYNSRIKETINWTTNIWVPPS